MLVFPCPKCQKRLRVDEGLAGKQGRCPACKHTIMFPQLSQTARPAAAPESPEDDAPMPTETLVAPATEAPPKAKVPSKPSPAQPSGGPSASVKTGGVKAPSPGSATKKILLVAIPIIVIVVGVLCYLVFFRKP